LHLQLSHRPLNLPLRLAFALTAESQPLNLPLRLAFSHIARDALLHSSSQNPYENSFY